MADSIKILVLVPYILAVICPKDLQLTELVLLITDRICKLMIFTMITMITVQIAPLIKPTSLKEEGHDRIPMPTMALKVLANASALFNLTIYFSDFLSMLNL